jgi:hypothetical protein
MDKKLLNKLVIFILETGLMSLIFCDQVLAAKFPAADGFPENSCYRFTPPGSVDASDHVEPNIEVWCYRTVTDTISEMHPMKQVRFHFIYNADAESVRPELAAIVDEEGMITHGSRLAGQVSVHKVRMQEFNPLPVPINPVEMVNTNRAKRLPTTEETSLLLLGDDVFQLLRKQKIESQSGFSIFPQSQLIRERASSLPWRGFWWPYKSGRLSNGDKSPMAKLDKLISTRNEKAGAQDWEEKNHGYTGVDWEGHCNGWAASAILREEPRRPKTDPISGEVFTVSDLKGLYAEKDTCVKYAFYGERFRGNPDDDLHDIHADVFHQTLRYYIGELKKPIVMDRMQGVGIENNIISGYTMTMKKLKNHLYAVTAILTVHKYDNMVTEKSASAPAVRISYRYTLEYDDANQIVGGTWQSKNPDFFWIPLSASECTRANPFVTEARLEQIASF